MKQLTFSVIGDEVVTRGKDYVQPRGYAHFPGTGPAGETCGSCVFAQRWRRFAKCRHEYAERKHTRGRGTDILLGSPACKYWIGCRGGVGGTQNLIATEAD